MLFVLTLINELGKTGNTEEHITDRMLTKIFEFT